MNMIFILEHNVCCYRYSPNLRARAYFINDRRLISYKWTEEETAAYRKERTPEDEEFVGFFGFQLRILREHIAKAQQEGKSLIVVDYGDVGGVLEELLLETRKRGERNQWLILSFFHDDETMQDLQFADPTEELIKDKIQWLEDMGFFPFIKTLEIDYNETLHEDYLKQIYEDNFTEEIHLSTHYDNA